jgi:hypothetical protein
MKPELKSKEKDKKWSNRYQNIFKEGCCINGKIVCSVMQSP